MLEVNGCADLIDVSVIFICISNCIVELCNTNTCSFKHPINKMPVLPACHIKVLFRPSHCHTLQMLSLLDIKY